MDSQAYKIRVNTRDNKRTRAILEHAYTDSCKVYAWGTGEIGTGIGKKILDYLGIKIDFYCDSNPDNEGKVFSEDIVCIKPETMLSDGQNKVCFILTGYAAIDSINQIIGDSVDWVITYDDLLELPEVLEHFLPYKNDKIAIYTCISGDYDDLREPLNRYDGCDYYLVSEKPPIGESAFKWINIDDVVPKSIVNPIYKNRYCKMHPHEIFPDYKYSIYIDGNVTLIDDIGECTKELENKIIGVGGYNYTNNMYVYALRCIEFRCDEREKILNQVKKYYLEGFPENFGSFYCGILARMHNNPRCIQLMNDWWEEYCKHANRDQVSLPYVLWKNGYSKDDVFSICDMELYNPWVKTKYWTFEKKHKKKRYRVQ